MKTLKCTKCGEEKPATAEYFYKGRNKTHGLDTKCRACRAKYYQDNKEYIAKQKHDHYMANADIIKQRVRRWQRAHVEERAEYYRAYAEKRRERLKQYAQEYRRKYPERISAHMSRRRTRVLKAEGSHTWEDVRRQYKAQNGRCYYCKAKVGNKYHADHVIPLSRGGSNNPENIVIACPDCNWSKRDRMPHEWSQGGRLL